MKSRRGDVILVPFPFCATRRVRETLRVFGTFALDAVCQPYPYMIQCTQIPR